MEIDDKKLYLEKYEKKNLDLFIIKSIDIMSKYCILTRIFFSGY